MPRYSHDVIIVGGGSGGLTATVGCAQLGMKTALVEKARLGGDCLHYGCVPSKSLIKTATVYRQARDAKRYGLPELSVPRVEMRDVNARVAGVIAEIEKHDSPERFRKLGAEVFFGQPEFVSPHELRLNNGQTLSARSIILATGSSPRIIPLPGLEEAGYITNLDVFSLDRLPDRLVAIGAGPIGTELGQAFARLGSKVTLVDVAPQILRREDEDMAAVVQQRLAAEGVDLKLNAKVERVERADGGKRVVLANGDGGEEIVDADEILVALGRQGNTDGLGLEAVGVDIERSFVKVDAKLRSTQKHILAIGDVNGRFLFTHVAGAEGSVAVRRVALHAGGSMSYRNVPWCTYAEPQLASIGYNEKRAREAGIEYDVIVHEFTENDRAHAEGETGGRMKILLDRRGRTIGTQIVAEHAGELLAPSLLSVSSGWKPGRLMGPIFPYPTLSEAHKKAASGYLAPRLFNDRVRGLLRFLFRYRGAGGREGR
jgi:pyruvate/2-oxoglutarate dehydrogenase complex dihydrolipoamide dehydrogenase (E3) component